MKEPSADNQSSIRQRARAEPGEPVAVRGDLLVGQVVERVGRVRQLVRNERPIGRAIRVADFLGAGVALDLLRGALRQDVGVGLDEGDAEERRAGAFRRPAIAGRAVERAERRVQPLGQLLVDVDPVVLPLVAVQPEDDAFVLGALERRVEVGVALALADREVGVVELPGPDDLFLVIVVDLVGVVRDAVGLVDPGARGVPGVAAIRVDPERMRRRARR